MNNYDIDTLVQIKSSFQSNKFQWIKTNDRSKLGTVVEVRDVLPGRNNRFIAVLSDGSRLDTDEVSSNLMMLTDDQTAMSMQEVLSINYIPSLSDDLKVSADLPQDYASEILTKPEPVSSPVKAVNPDPQATVTEPSKVSVDTTDLFGMFSLEDTDLELTVRVKLPAKELLKMMYANSKNKDEFLTKLSNYINNSVTSDSIKKTMKKFFSGSASRKKSSRSDD
jgi:hypothetical protein